MGCSEFDVEKPVKFMDVLFFLLEDLYPDELSAIFVFFQNMF